jgi:catechol 2,3-dioxygenase-like lactoylglutathione lyase family enzyme
MMRNAITVMTVKDLAQSLAYYRDKLGFEIAFQYGEPAFYAGLFSGEVPASSRRRPTSRTACAISTWPTSTATCSSSGWKPRRTEGQDTELWQPDLRTLIRTAAPRLGRRPKQAESDRFHAEVSEWKQRGYFSTF